MTAVIALAEAKAWDLELDKTAKVGPARYANPSLQINNYLRDANITWGILTNGRKWRLYNKETSLHLDSYYEVDLVELIEFGSPEDFKYFYLFFRREAFVREASVPSFLDDIFTGSIRYAKELEEDVKENIYDALRLLSKGFLAHPDNRLQASDLVRIHENSLILLYRLLFVLYAEAKGLLPFKNPLYRDMSLERLREDIKRELDKPVPTLTVAGDSFWARLSVLFRLVNEGSEARNVPQEHLFIPPYNGGLFDPTKHPFLETAKVGDKYLAQALHLLSWSGGRNGRLAGFVDYTTLSVRHLGSIYEGLLEYKPIIAEDDLIVTKEKGREVFKKASEIQLTPRQLRNLGRVPKGDIYLQTDKGERKATGSYYTPDYIVKYIVENTLGALVEEIRGRGLKGMDFVREVLSLNVLDPAMGSGHFLVEATSFLAARIVESLVEAEEDAQPAAEAEVLWARREVARRCIYGVDLNPLAVELAKVSLWLHTVTKDKPLSFLDHHLKCGNSLIGTRLVDLPWYPELDTRKSAVRIQKVDLEGPKPIISKLLEAIKRLELTPDETLQQVKEKERIFKELKETSEYLKIKALCDVRTSVFFGNTIEERQYQDFVNHVFYGTQQDWLEDQKRSWFKKAEMSSGSQRFFHWELEFPEVFASGKGGGFDAVVGNPPYVNALELARTGDPLEREFLRANFVSAKRAFDLYIPFLELAQRSTRQGGRSGLITPNKFLSAPYGESLREYLAKEKTLERVLDASQVGVFEDPAVYPIVTVFLNSSHDDSSQVAVEVLEDANGSPRVKGSFVHSLLTAFPESLWSFLLSGNVDLISRLAVNCERLEKVATIQASTTAAEADLYTSMIFDCNDLSTHSEHFPVVNTGLVDRYENRWGSEPLTHAGRIFGRPCLDKTESRLGEMRRTLYGKPKLIVAKVAYVPEVCMDEAGEFAAVNVNFVCEPEYDLGFLLAVLNSRLMDHIYHEYFGALTMQGAYAQFQAPQLRLLPIPQIDFSEPESRRKTTLGKILGFYESTMSLRTVGADEVRDLAARVLSTTPNSPQTLSVFHDFLALLAKQMTEMHSTKRKHIDRFLSWMESPLGLGLSIKALKNRTKLLSFYEHPGLGTEGARRELETVLAQNKVQTGAEKLAALEREYERAASALIPTLNRISATDALIDVIVYRLYGLTAAEVGMVEGISEDAVRKKYGWPSE